MKNQSPCYGCPDHQFGCRPGCEKWATFEAAKREEYAQRRAAAAAEPSKPGFDKNIRRKIIRKARGLK